MVCTKTVVDKNPYFYYDDDIMIPRYRSFFVSSQVALMHIGLTLPSEAYYVIFQLTLEHKLSANALDYLPKIIDAAHLDPNLSKIIIITCDKYIFSYTFCE